MAETLNKDKSYYESLDKRTKEYKDWVASQDETLLGNRIEQFTEATGIKKVVETVTKALGIKDCGCNTRKDEIKDFHARIRKMFIHKQPIDLMTEEEYTFLVDYFKQNKTRVSAEEQRAVYKVYNRLFEENVKPTSCPSCYKRVAGRLKQLIELQRA
jgi:hypothetical protein